MDIQQVLALHQKALEGVSRFHKKRYIYNSLINDQGKHYLALIGPRGSGKTILLRQIASEFEHAVYISLDALQIDNLFELISTLNEYYHFQTFLIDEIHYYQDYEQDLKKIYDFLDIKIFFTSSVALSLYESTYDLSRRVKILNLFSFSFGEYIYFKQNLRLPCLSVQDILLKKWQPEHIRSSYLFTPFLQGGILPFVLDEPDMKALLQNILDKIIFKDIPLIAKLNLTELYHIKKIVTFIGRSSVEGISYSSLSANLNITKYKAEQYVQLLEKAFVLQCVWPKGTNVLKEPKVLMCLPYRLLFATYEQALGGLREDFFVEMMRIKGTSVSYLKSTRGAKTPDYLVQTQNNTIIIEIGGKGKGIQQFKGIKLKKSLILSHSNETSDLRRPLFLAGF